MRYVIKKSWSWSIMVICLTLAMGGFFTYLSHVHAAALTTLSDQLSTVKKGTAADHDIRFRTPTGQSSGTITVDFNTAAFTTTGVDNTDIDFQYGATAAQVNGSCSSGCTPAVLGATASTGGQWGAAIAANVLTLTYPTGGGTAIAANDYVRIMIGHNATGTVANTQITNPSTNGNKVITITTASDVAKVAEYIVDNDQVVVTGNVDPSMTFIVSANASAFGLIATNAVKDGGTNIDLTVGTNAANGYTIYVNDVGNGTNPGLYNAAGNYLIGSSNAAYAAGPTTLAAGTEGYGIRAQGTSGTPTIDAPYNNATTGIVGGLKLTQQPLAHHDGVMSASDIVRVYHHAAISTVTVAGYYTDTITYVATGRF